MAAILWKLISELSKFRKWFSASAKQNSQETYQKKAYLAVVKYVFRLLGIEEFPYTELPAQSHPVWPRTFRDAIVICRSLGLRYLWIDALCIIQDHDADWSVEAGRMKDYYSDASICIAATAAADGSQGCFVNRDPVLSYPCLLNLSQTSLEISMNSAENPMFVYYLPFNSINYTRRESPLRQRAWTFQEEYLSPRFLEFGKGQMAWKCSQLNATESEPDLCNHPVEQGQWVVNARMRKNGSNAEKQQLKTRSRRRGDGAFYNSSWYDEWYNNIQIYADRNLSFETDRLAALAGFADVASRYVLQGDEYLAGLWRKDLLFGLTWYILPVPKPDLNDPAYVAPSWSWASIGCRYLYSAISPSGDMHEIPGVLIHEASTQLKSKTLDASPYGQVVSGKLILVAPLEPFSLWPTKDNPRNGHLTYPIKWVNVESAVAKCLQSAIFHSDFEDAFQTHQHQYLWFLPLHSSYWTISGLALAPVTVSQNVYRRVGIVTYYEHASVEFFKDEKFLRVTIV